MHGVGVGVGEWEGRTCGAASPRAATWRREGRVGEVIGSEWEPS